MATSDPLSVAAEAARRFLAGVADRPVGSAATPAELTAALGGPLPEDGVDAARVVADLARAADPGIVASAGPRYFGFVVGGSLPAAVGADWLTTAWDQNAGIYVLSPAAAVVEDVAAGWLLDLAAARTAVLRRASWDVEQRGLFGAPEIEVIVGGDAHVTIFTSLRLLGLGAARVRTVAADEQGRMRPEALRDALAGGTGPAIVCAQLGNVNTGACDPLEEIAPLARARGAWLHVDGAFGLWAATSPRHRHHTAGAARADSWATDAHKWLNVPYDSGVAIVADSAAHRAAFTATAAYLVKGGDGRRDAEDWTPEFSRRARGFPVYAALRALGRRGVAALVDRCCDLARLMATRLRAVPGAEILNDVVLNQVLVRFRPSGGGDPGAFTQAVITRVQQDGTCWLGGTTWRGSPAMRISVSNWSTTAADVERSAAAIAQAARG